MKFLVTLSDKKYLNFGLVLFDSLKKTSSNTSFRLYYLCMDDESYSIIKDINDDRLIPYHINNIVEEDDFKKLCSSSMDIDKEMKNIYKNIDDFSNFHFASASYITYHLIKKYDLPELLYIDSDIIFYHDINILFDVVKNKSIGIVLHRHNEFGCEVGAYNVGIVYFRNDKAGIKCLKWWRDCLIDKTNPWAKEYGKWGDQKYLEAFGKLFDDENIKIFDDEIGHGAPWNFRLYKYLEDDHILWNNKNQKLIFNHFSQFNPDYVNDTYKYDRNGCWGGCLYPNNNVPSRIKEYYDDYFDYLKRIKEKYNL